MQPLQDRYPWLVALQGGTIGGIAYAKPWNPRRAYDWTTEVTVYVRDGLQGQGIGSALYQRLLELLEAQGFRSMMAGITLPNDASVALHESFGFRQVGTLRRIGFKMGAWHDVGHWQRWVTADPDAEPTPLRPLDEVEP